MPKKCKKEEGPPPPPAWMTTFSDLNSLLMTFFVMLFSMSTISPGKFQQAAISFRSVFEGTPPSILTGGKSLSTEPLITSQPGIRRELLKIVMDEKYKGKITIKESDKGTIIVMRDMAFFKPKSAELTEEAKKILYQIGIIIIEHTRNVLEIYGYTDDLPPGPESLYPSNWHLSAARAASVVKFFLQDLKERRIAERYGEVKSGQFVPNLYYDPSRFFPIGLGDRDIKTQIKILKEKIERKKAREKEKFERGEISLQELVNNLKSYDKEFEDGVKRLRELFRRIDILILRERVR